MANKSKVYTATTVSTVTASVSQVLRIRWTGVTTAAHALTLTDANDNFFMTFKAQAANDTFDVDFANPSLSCADVYRLQGIKVSVIGSGQVDIYVL